jgi:hypothetical protein
MEMIHKAMFDGSRVIIHGLKENYIYALFLYSLVATLTLYNIQRIKKEKIYF